MQHTYIYMGDGELVVDVMKHKNRGGEEIR
jgi:hypothetical protein